MRRPKRGGHTKEASVQSIPPINGKKFEWKWSHNKDRQREIWMEILPKQSEAIFLLKDSQAALWEIFFPSIDGQRWVRRVFPWIARQCMKVLDPAFLEIRVYITSPSLRGVKVIADRIWGARLLLNFSPKKYDFQNEWLSSLCVAYCGRWKAGDQNIFSHGRPFPKIAAANNPTFLYSIRLLLQYFRGVALVLSIVLVLVLVLVVVAVPHCAVQW